MRGGRVTTVNNRHLWIMVTGYVRYAMGRRSTAPSEAEEMTRTYWHAFADVEQAQLREEIRREVQHDDAHPGHLGHECDRRLWRALLAWCEARP